MRARRLFAGVVLPAIASALLACGGGAPPNAEVPNTAVHIPLEVYDFTLPNGLRVVLDEDHLAPKVAVHVHYKVGSKDDPPERPGFAHFFEHLMFEGTRGIEGSVLPALQEIGATEMNGATSFDETSYYETVPAGALEWAIWFEAERMARLRLDEAIVERERSVVKNEYRQKFEVDGARFLELFRNRAIFGPEHPYAHYPIGTPEALDRATLDELRAFHQRFYRPGNAVLSLVGDFDHREATAMIAKYFGAVPRGAPASPVRVAPPAPLAAEKRIWVEANIETPHVVVAYPAPPEGASDLPALHAMAGKIWQTMDHWLRDQRGIARSIHWEVEERLLGSIAAFDFALREGATPADYQEVVRVFDEAVFEKDARWFGAINFHLNEMRSARIFRFERFASRAALYAWHDDAHQNPLFFAREIEANQNTSRADVFAAQQKYLQTRKRVIMFVNTNKSAPHEGRLL